MQLDEMLPNPLSQPLIKDLKTKSAVFSAENFVSRNSARKIRLAGSLSKKMSQPEFGRKKIRLQGLQYTKT